MKLTLKEAIDEIAEIKGINSSLINFIEYENGSGCKFNYRIDSNEKEFISLVNIKTRGFKLTQHLWNWWFFLSLLFFISMLSIAITTNSVKEIPYITEWLIISMLNMIPVLYVGTKPTLD
jgi:hypothetical protein